MKPVACTGVSCFVSGPPFHKNMSLCNKLLKICVFFHVLPLKLHFAPELTREQLVSENS